MFRCQMSVMDGGAPATPWIAFLFASFGHSSFFRHFDIRALTSAVLVTLVVALPPALMRSLSPAGSTHQFPHADACALWK
jgi:hypothetical protein